MTSQPLPWWKEAIRDIIAGTIGGIAGKIIDHPFDTVKVRLQAEGPGTGPAGAPPRFHGPVDCLVKTLRFEGVRALYAGMSIPLLGTVFETAIMFTANGLFRRALVSSGRLAEGEALPLSMVLASGAASGSVVALVLTPAELIKCRLQVQVTGGSPGGLQSSAPSSPLALPYAGPIDCLRRSVAEEGVGVLFRGHTATLLREVPGTAVWFATYEAVVRAATHAREGPPSAPLVVGAGGLAGCAYWAAIYPVDTVKTAQQTAVPGSRPLGFGETLRAIFRAGGVRALYAGLAPTLIRAFPSNAAVFLLYEQAVAVMGTP